MPFFRFRLELADRDRFCDDPLFLDPLLDAVRPEPLRPEPLREAVVVERLRDAAAPERLVFGLTVVGRITSGGSSL